MHVPNLIVCRTPWDFMNFRSAHAHQMKPPDVFVSAGCESFELLQIEEAYFKVKDACAEDLSGS